MQYLSLSLKFIFFKSVYILNNDNNNNNYYLYIMHLSFSLQLSLNRSILRKLKDHQTNNSPTQITRFDFGNIGIKIIAVGELILHFHVIMTP